MTENVDRTEPTRGVEIQFQKIGGISQTIYAEALIVACDPRSLGNIMDLTTDEKSVFSHLQSYTFNTTLVEVTVPAGGAEFGIYLKPQAIKAMSGTICGFRNETAKAYSLDKANGMQKNLVTIYQLRGPRHEKWNATDFRRELERVLPTLDWWPYETNFQCKDKITQFDAGFTTEYFDHFDAHGLAEELPWTYLNLQGKNRTFYVHASTCFESVLQCYQYIENLFTDRKALLPTDLSAPIAIMGAGVSGLLAAYFLKKKHGYTDVTLYEITDRFGGKTVTVTEASPKPDPLDPDTACELGTCYLSPAYDDMVTDLAAYFEGNARLGFRRHPLGGQPDPQSFRGIVTEGQFPPAPTFPDVMDYNQFVMLKGMKEAGLKITGDPQKDYAHFKDAMLHALKTYLKLHELIMGPKLPMPDTPPHMVLTGAESGSFYDFLKRNNLLVMTGLLEYAYSVQGYGPLAEIPAYYGLVWISGPMVRSIIDSMQSESTAPLVTYLEKGWLDVWRKMAHEFDIRTAMEATRIYRAP